MRCVFQIRRGPEWSETRDAAPKPGAEVEYVGANYTVETVEWWFGGTKGDAILSDVLVTLRGPALNGSSPHSN